MILRHFALNHSREKSKIFYGEILVKTEDYIMNRTTGHSAAMRIQALLDPNSFVELGAGIHARSTDFHLYKEETPGDGVITGYGLINEQLVYIYSQDSSVLGGAIGEMHSRKITNLYDMALKMGAPIIGILDCSGLRLQESTDAMNGLGAIYQKQAAASGIIPQLMLVMGNCGGGLSVIPALADFTFVEQENGKLFLQSPDSILSNTKEHCDTTSSNWKSVHTQNIDFCGTEEDIYIEVRRFLSILPANNRFSIVQDICNDDPNRLCEDIKNAASDTAILLSMIADQYEFIETKKETAMDMATGFLRLNGMTIGCVANRQSVSDKNFTCASVLTADGAKKAADFIRFCDAFRIPVLTISNITGFEQSFETESHAADAFAALTSAYAGSTIPKVTLIVEQAMGSAGVMMGSRSLGTDLVYAWENATIGPMDANQAARILYEGESMATIRQEAAKYNDLQNSTAAAASRGYIDGIIKPQDTRKYLISAFDMLATKLETGYAKKHLSI
jgi:acetyl-CoA carboxylase carboxyltransferase component